MEKILVLEDEVDIGNLVPPKKWLRDRENQN